MRHRILIIGSVWVEPTSSAAGSRMLQLIDVFLSQDWEVHFASTAQKNDNAISLKSKGVQERVIELNNTSFDVFVKALAPSLVVFDRFMIEEQFGWRVAEQCPNALRVLDTEDLHCLRNTRHECLKKGVEFSADELLKSTVAKREIASIFRCDLSLIISSVEMELLETVFKVPKALLLYLPFWTTSFPKKFKSFEERVDFISIGNFLHAPNLDATLQLKKEIWPLIRKRIPKANLQVYGAYPNQQVLQLHNEKEGFLVKGYVKDANKAMQNARVLLAPLRFGAGLKGKLLEAMSNGTPSVTTSIGAEGMCSDLPWGGSISDNPKEFAEKTVELYQDSAVWVQAQKNGVQIVSEMFQEEAHKANLINEITAVYDILESHRTQNFFGSLLQHHTLQSTKYLSKWIEAKNNKQ